MRQVTLFALLFVGGRFVLGDSVTRSIETGEVTFAGKGCVAPEDVSVALSADGKELRVAFKSDFVAKSTEGSTHTRVACNGVIPVEVPTGYSVGISKDVLEGFVSIPLKEKGSDAEAHYVQVTSEFFFAAQRRGPKLKQRFETPGVARFSVDGLPSETIWSSCNTAQARLRINTALIAHGNASAIGFGSLGADKEVQGNPLRFAISYKKCTSAGDDKTEADEVDGDEADSDEEQASEV